MYQSEFRKKHSTITAAMKVLTDITESLDKKQHCVSHFIDLSKSFDTFDHAILRQRLSSVGLSEHAVAWFANYLSDRTQCTLFDGLISVCSGVPQGCVLGPILITIYINNLDKNVQNAQLHFYADDTVIYSYKSFPEHANCFLYCSTYLVSIEAYQYDYNPFPIANLGNNKILGDWLAMPRQRIYKRIRP